MDTKDIVKEIMFDCMIKLQAKSNMAHNIKYALHKYINTIIKTDKDKEKIFNKEYDYSNLEYLFTIQIHKKIDSLLYIPYYDIILKTVKKTIKKLDVDITFIYFDKEKQTIYIGYKNLWTATPIPIMAIKIEIY